MLTRIVYFTAGVLFSLLGGLVLVHGFPLWLAAATALSLAICVLSFEVP